MPLFRLKAPMPHLEDAAFLYAENPDADRFEEVPDTEAATAPPAPVAASAPEPQPEESE